MRYGDSRGVCSAATVAFITGLALGAVTAVLLAPQPGETTRRAIKGYARRTEEEVLEKANEIRSKMNETIEESKRFLTETKNTITSALEAAKAAFKKEMANKA